MPQYSFNIESEGCRFDLKAASFVDQTTAEQFARRLCTFFHPKLWSPTVVMCDEEGDEVFRSSDSLEGQRSRPGVKLSGTGLDIRRHNDADR